MFIFFAATQDIAVDGWALTLLSGPNLSYASTAQTIGLTIGSTLSNTVFLALNSVEFSNTWLRRVPSLEPAITLEGYLKFWAGVYFFFTIWLVVAQKEDATSDDDPDLDVRKVYKVMGTILKLKSGCPPCLPHRVEQRLLIVTSMIFTQTSNRSWRYISSRNSGSKPSNRRHINSWKRGCVKRISQPSTY